MMRRGNDDDRARAVDGESGEPGFPDRDGDEPVLDDDLPRGDWLDAYSDDFLVDVGSHAASRDGIVHLVGTGVGDPGQLTVRARSLLQRCDAIVHDPELPPETLRLLATLRPRGGLHTVGRDDDGAGNDADAGEILVRLAREGMKVVRLSGGNPFSAGSGAAEMQELVEAGIPFDVVSGMVPEIAAATYAGIPALYPGMSASMTIVGDLDPAGCTTSTADWAALAAGGGTLMFRTDPARADGLPGIAAELIASGVPAEMPAAAVRWIGSPRQRTVVSTVGTLAADVVGDASGGTVTVVMGWTVVLRDELAWAERRPLHGRRILLASGSPGSALAASLREQGAWVVELPVTRVEQMDPGPLREALQWLEQYDWIAFASRVAVRDFWRELRAGGRDARALSASRLVAVGPAAVAALRERGLEVDIGGEDPTVEALTDAFGERDDVQGSRVLYLTGAGEGDPLALELERSGAMLEVVPLHDVVVNTDAIDPLRALLTEGGMELLILPTLPAVRAVVEGAGVALARGIPVLAVTPAVADEARAHDLDVRAEVDTPTAGTVVSAVSEVLDGGDE